MELTVWICSRLIKRRYRKYNPELQKRICTLLRHHVLSAKMDMWADGFVYLDDVFCRVRKYTENNLPSLAAVFRESFMNTLIDDSGARFKIVYLASKKQWRFPVSGHQDFRSDVKSADDIHASGIRTAGELKPGYYIRVEAGTAHGTRQSTRNGWMNASTVPTRDPCRALSLRD